MMPDPQKNIQKNMVKVDPFTLVVAIAAGLLVPLLLMGFLFQ